MALDWPRFQLGRFSLGIFFSLIRSLGTVDLFIQFLFLSFVQTGAGIFSIRRIPAHKLHSCMNKSIWKYNHDSKWKSHFTMIMIIMSSNLYQWKRCRCDIHWNNSDTALINGKRHNLNDWWKIASVLLWINGCDLMKHSCSYLFFFHTHSFAPNRTEFHR